MTQKQTPSSENLKQPVTGDANPQHEPYLGDDASLVSVNNTDSELKPNTEDTDDNGVPKRHRLAALKAFMPRRSARLIAGLTILIAVLLFAILVPIFLHDPNRIDNIGLSAPTAEHILGTTQTGQDIFTQLAWSTRGSLIIGFSVALISIVVSVFFGVFGTYIGGWLDEAFALLTNIFLVIPGLPLIIVIAALVPNKGQGMLIMVLSFTAWAGASRVLRAVTLSMRGRDYVSAARIAGMHPLQVICVEILPNLLPVIASQFTFSVIFAILGESSLSFIGLGSPSANSLGTMLFYANGSNSFQSGSWWWFLPPGFMIALVGAGLSFINFSIDEVVNPKLRTLPKAVRKKFNKATTSTTKKAQVA